MKLILLAFAKPLIGASAGAAAWFSLRVESDQFEFELHEHVPQRAEIHPDVEFEKGEVPLPPFPEIPKQQKVKPEQTETPEALPGKP